MELLICCVNVNDKYVLSSQIRKYYFKNTWKGKMRWN